MGQQAFERVVGVVVSEKVWYTIGLTVDLDAVASRAVIEWRRSFCQETEPRSMLARSKMGLWQCCIGSQAAVRSQITK